MTEVSNTPPSLSRRRSGATDPEASAAARKAAYAAQEVGESAAQTPELRPIAPALTAAVTPKSVIPPTVAQVNVAAAGDPFADLANIRVDQNFANTPGLKTLRTIIPVRRPGKQEFFRVNPDPAYRLAAAIMLDETEDQEVYLLMGGLHHQLPGEFRLVNLRLTISTQDVLAIWPVTVPGYNGETPNSWHLSAENAASTAETQWTRMRAVKALGGYQLTVADGALAKKAPQWPTDPFSELLKTAFAGKYIDNLQHPLVQRLFGHA
jgi:hypothetical protein